MGLYLRPATLEDALAALGARRWTVLAGATDHFPARGDTPPDEDILDISALPRAITREGEGWHIPCGATWADVIAADLPPAFDALKQAAGQVGGRQVQNMGTLAGNLCNASPAADGVPCLLAMQAEVAIAGPRGERLLDVAEFVLGPRRTALAADEIVTGLHIPAPSGRRSAFVKLGARRFLVISIAMAAVSLDIAAGVVTGARVALGACGPVAARLPEVEAALVGHAPDPGRVQPAQFAGLAPIDDIRATAAYRREAAVELVRRAVGSLA